jgi:hypothetical protein
MYLRRYKLAALAVVVGIGLYLGFALSANATPLPARVYGVSSSHFTVAFGAQPEFRDLSDIPSSGKYFLNMAPQSSLYVASLASNTFESVEVDAYPRPLTPAEIDRYIHVHLFGFQPTSWHGLAAAEMNVACHEGDTPQACPGRIAQLVVIAGRSIYDLDAEQVSATEVKRFFGSFQVSK